MNTSLKKSSRSSRTKTIFLEGEKNDLKRNG